MRTLGKTLLCAAVLLPQAACNEGSDGGSGDSGDGSDLDPGTVMLSSGDRLVRVSMAIRGLHPSAEDLEAVEADPNRLGEFVDRYLQTPEFGDTIRDLHNESLLTVTDYFAPPAGFTPSGPVADVDIYALNRAIMEAPLRLIEDVILNDQPYTDIVTADYTLANGTVAAVWGLPYGGDGNTWERTSWDDGRGRAGILSDSWLFSRHSSTESNANRGRANAVARGLLCYDFLARDIDVDSAVDLADPAVVSQAVVDNPTCASCHQALDPLASFFSGYYPTYLASEVTYPHRMYYENLFPTLGVQMRPESYFGSRGSGLRDLGELIAGDPRFSLCAARRFYAYFHQIELGDVPFDDAARLQRSFIDSGYDARELVRTIVTDSKFLTSHADPEDASETNDPVGVKKARPYQLAQTVRDITGFEWWTTLVIPEEGLDLGRVNLMDDSGLGYQVLGGGIDGVFVTRSSHVYSATNSLVLQALAREAAHHVVERDFADAERRLLTAADPADDGEDSVRTQLVHLSSRIYAQILAEDDPVIDELHTLYRDARAAGGDAKRAWKVVVTAMLQDHRMAFY